MFHCTLADGHALVRIGFTQKLNEMKWNEQKNNHFQMRTKNEKRYETFKMQIHAADEVYNVYMFCSNLRHQQNGTVVLDVAHTFQCTHFLCFPNIWFTFAIRFYLSKFMHSKHNNIFKYSVSADNEWFHV